MKRIWFVLAVSMVLFASGSPASVVLAEGEQAMNAREAGLEKSEFEMTHIESAGELSVTVTGKQLADVYAFELQLEFDPLRLQLTGATTKMKGFTVKPIVKGNRILFAHTLVGDMEGVTGEMELVELAFKRIRGGNTSVILREVKVVNSLLSSVGSHLDKSVRSIDRENRVQLMDIAGHWAEQEIRTAVELGFVSGYKGGVFRPNNFITRAEFTTLLSRALLLSAKEEPSFADELQIPDWARTYVAAAVKSGFVKGYDDDTFRPNRLINRAELAVMIARGLSIQPVTGEMPDFADSVQIPEWTKPSIELAVNQGMLNGRGGNRFAPNDNLTRAEGVVVLLRLLSNQ